MTEDTFVEPEDYSVEEPVVTMNGRKYTIFKRSAAISFGACPRSIADTLRKLDKEFEEKQQDHT